MIRSAPRTLTVSLLCVLLFARCGGDQQVTRPNVLVLFVDDLGLEVLESYDTENMYPPGVAERDPLIYPHTPTIDRLARDGVRFTRMRVNPTCSASRATLLTGRYPFRHGIGGVIRRANTSKRYSQAETIELGVGPGNREWTIAHLARAAGYRSLMAGKWHLALLEKNVALDGEPGSGWEHVRTVAGFDEAWTIWGNLPGWPTPEPIIEANRRHEPGYYNFVAAENGVAVNVRGDYLTTLQIDRVLQFVDLTDGQPWLVYAPFNAVHSPRELPPAELVHTPEYLEAARGWRAGGREDSLGGWAVYMAMVEALDHELGRLLDGLEQRGVLEDTLVILLTDNGTPRSIASAATLVRDVDLGETAEALVQAGEVRFKHQVWEPGIRVPMIVRGPGVVAPGRTSDALVDGSDVFETVRDLLGVTREAAGLPPEHIIDGVSFLPLLRASGDDTAHARDFAFAEHFEPNGNPEAIEFRRGQMAKEYMVRRGFVLDTPTGRFKLVRNHDSTGSGRDELFQLSDASGAPVDPWEQAPIRVAPDNPEAEVLAALQRRLDTLVRTELDNWR